MAIDVPPLPPVPADRVLRAWRRAQDRWIAPGLPVAAIAVPEAILKELGLPECAFDAVSALWEAAVTRAVDETIAAAGELG